MPTDRNLLTRERVEHALRLCHTPTKAAAMLGVGPQAIYRACRRWGIAFKRTRSW